jgi:hypothetical protein
MAGHAYIDDDLFRLSLGAYTRSAFYALEARKLSLELDFGVWWTHGRSWPKYRVSLVEDTGELIAVRQASAPLLEIYYVLAVLDSPPREVADMAPFRLAVRAHADELLDGWAGDEAGNHLDWVLRRVTGRRDDA